MIISYGKCGIACEICPDYGSLCKGCQIENEENPDIYNCAIFICAADKNVQSCLSCIEYPCPLIKGLSKAYCPVNSVKRLQATQNK